VRVAVVGHVEWVEFALVERVPAPGEIVHAERTWTAPAGGGAVAAVQLARLAGEATFFTALGDDELGRRAATELEALGVRVEVAWRAEAQRRAFVHVDRGGERTITVIGERLGPSAADLLPWDDLGAADAVYFTAGDAGAVRAARAAEALVATARAMESLAAAAVELDALVASRDDAGERYEAGELDPPPRAVVRTAGAAGGEWERAASPSAKGTTGTWEAVPPPGPVADAYGCGDSFAAGLTYGLGARLPLERAIALGARCGAVCLTGHGPYEARLDPVRAI
jgi:ribokinase